MRRISRVSFNKLERFPSKNYFKFIKVIMAALKFKGSRMHKMLKQKCCRGLFVIFDSLLVNLIPESISKFQGFDVSKSF